MVQKFSESDTTPTRSLDKLRRYAEKILHQGDKGCMKHDAETEIKYIYINKHRFIFTNLKTYQRWLKSESLLKAVFQASRIVLGEVNFWNETKTN